MALKLTKNKSPDPQPGCPLTECMSILGGAWTPNILWNLSGGPRRFNELRLDIPKVSAKVLTVRLRALEAKGVVQRDVRPTSPPSVEYGLTELGEELIPVIQAIVSVGHRLKQRGGRMEDQPSAAGQPNAGGAILTDGSHQPGLVASPDQELVG